MMTQEQQLLRQLIEKINRLERRVNLLDAQEGGGGAVDSVNGQVGVVVLDTDDIAEGVTNLYLTQERVEDYVAAQFTGNTGLIDATYNDTTGAITLTLDVSAADKMLYSTAADTWAETTLTSFIRTLLDDTSAALARGTLGLAIGVDVQGYDAELAALAGLTSAADRLPYFTGSGTAALATFTSAARGLLDDADAAAMRTTLGLGTIATEAETAYALLAGRAGGQSLTGGTGSGDDLTLQSTNHATKGTIFLGSGSAFDETNNYLGLNDTTPSHAVDANGVVSGTAIYRRTNAPVHMLESRTLPTTVDDYIELGNIANGIQGLTLIVSVNDSSFTVTKHYFIAASYDETTDASTFWTVLPVYDTGAFSGNNFALDMAVNNATVYFRLRRTAGSTAGTARVLILNCYGTFTASSTTGSMAAPTLFFGSYHSIDNALWMTTLRARTSAGLTITDDGSNLGMFLADGGAACFGLSTFGASVLGVKAGTSSNDAAVGGVLYVTTTQTGNVGTGEDALASYSVPANTLAVNGQSLWFEAWGTFNTGNSNSKTIRARFGTSGTTLIGASIAATNQNNGWFLRGRITRTGAATQRAYLQICFADDDSGSDDTMNFYANGLNQTLSGAVTLKVTGEATSNNDLVIEGFIVGWDDANT